MVWFSTQLSGMSPVFVEPTCTPEELKALDVVMGAAPPPTLRIVCTPSPKDSLGIELSSSSNGDGGCPTRVWYVGCACR